MKKQTIFILAAMLLAVNVQAQVGVGARGILGMHGNAYGGVEFSIQKLDKYELDLGFMNDSWKVTGLKLFPLVDRRNFGIYGGAGFGLGYIEPWNDTFGTFALDIGSYLKFGRIQLGLDWRPEWNFSYPEDNELGFTAALSARWVFGHRH